MLLLYLLTLLKEFLLLLFDIPSKMHLHPFAFSPESEVPELLTSPLWSEQKMLLFHLYNCSRHLISTCLFYLCTQISCVPIPCRVGARPQSGNRGPSRSIFSALSVPIKFASVYLTFSHKRSVTFILIITVFLLSALVSQHKEPHRRCR